MRRYFANVLSMACLLMIARRTSAQASPVMRAAD